MAKRARTTRIDITTYDDPSPKTVEATRPDEWAKQLDEAQARVDEARAQDAYDRAIAWARSPKGTPYGSTILKTEVDR